MKIDIMTLCDYAQYNNGKLIIVGTLNQINGTSLPARCDMYFVARLSFEPDEVLSDDVVLSIHHEGNGKKLVDNHVLLPKENFTPYDKGRRGVMNLMLNLNGFIFPDAGTYVFSLNVGRVVGQTYLDCVLVKSPEQSKETKPKN